MAQVTDVFHAVGGPASAWAEVHRRVGTWFDPTVVEALRVASAAEGFWAGLAAEGLGERVTAIEPIARVIVIDEDQLDVISEAFADIIDAKSAYTSGHSRRVTQYADAIAATLGLPPSRRRWLRRAALLHDIGKLGVAPACSTSPASSTPPSGRR